jgi:hypothetical protein
MDRRIESFLTTFSRSRAKSRTRSGKEVRVAIAKCEAIFRL